VFGGGDVGFFFDFYYESAQCIVATVDDEPVAAGYLLPAGNLVCGVNTIPCAMVYGVATLPEARSRGFGSAVVSRLISSGFESGFPTIVLCPSEDSLFEYYSARTAFRDWFYISEKTYNRGALPDNDSELIELTPQDYCIVRERILAGIPHIEQDLRAITYQSKLCSECGGGLFRIETVSGPCCAVVEKYPDGSIYIKELLSQNQANSHFSSPTSNDQSPFEIAALSAIARTFEADNYNVRVPSSSNKTAKRFGMISTKDESPSNFNENQILPWYGLAFD